MLEMLDGLVTRAQAAGAVRTDVGAVDVLMMVKGVCESARSFQHLDPSVAARQLDLVWSAICTPEYQRVLRGQPPTAEVLEQAHPAAATTAPEPAALDTAPEPAAAATAPSLGA
jgi:hypothetical protein